MGLGGKKRSGGCLCQESEDWKGRKKAEVFLSYVFKHAHCPIRAKSGLKLGNPLLSMSFPVRVLE